MKEKIKEELERLAKRIEYATADFEEDVRLVIHPDLMAAKEKYLMELHNSFEFLSGLFFNVVDNKAENQIHP